MSGLKRNTINDIINSLRDQYHNGFPVIKELIQNADDSGAKHFMFGLHQGFGKEIQHPLFQDTGLWCLNDGSFKSEDKEAIPLCVSLVVASIFHPYG